MSDQKIKNREALLSHGDAGAKAQVLELTAENRSLEEAVSYTHLTLPTNSRV